MRTPTPGDLSPDQKEAINLTLSGRFLVTGPPGSGKSLVALYRAQMLKKNRQTVTVITHSRLLLQFMQPWMNDLLLDRSVDTFHSWFFGFWLGNYGHRPPQLRRFEHDWHEILRQVMANPPTQRRPAHLIIDEGQDLSKEFYVVARLAADNLLVLADENQRITETQSTLDQIRSYGQITRSVELRSNHRNTAQIASVAAHFYTGLRTGIPQPPERSGGMPVMERFDSEASEIEAIMRYESAHRTASIGVLVPTVDLRRRVVAFLGEQTIHPVQEFVGGEGGHASPLSFSRPVITVATYQSAKGLEFDTVFLPFVHACVDDGVGIRMKLYVLCSRARHELFVSFSGRGDPAILAAFPDQLMDWRL
jgi:superfamily I DNA/RNA helicase